MPRCCRCGNDGSLASSFFAPTTKTANTARYGLVGNFDCKGRLSSMACQGASLDDAQQAYEDPEHYFDTCPLCGAKEIEWQ